MDVCLEQGQSLLSTTASLVFTGVSGLCVHTPGAAHQPAGGVSSVLRLTNGQHRAVGKVCCLQLRRWCLQVFLDCAYTRPELLTSLLEVCRQCNVSGVVVRLPDWVRHEFRLADLDHLLAARTYGEVSASPFVFFVRKKSNVVIVVVILFRLFRSCRACGGGVLA